MAPADKDGSDYRATLVKYWMEKAWESFEAAKSDNASNRLSTAVRNIYYGCFYALTALFYKQGKSFRKHTAVRAALHRDLIKTGKIDAKWGRFYNKVFDRRQEGDYEPLVTFDSEQVEQFIQEANKFIREMDRRLNEHGSTES